MNRKLVYTLLFLLLGVTVITSCRDDFFYEDGVIGEGSANISATVSFHPLVSALDKKSRAAGDAIKDITKLQVVIYTAQGEFFKSITLSEEANNLNIIDSSSEEANTGMPENYEEQDQAEEKTAKASFELKDIPFGRYYMYVVANYNGEFNEINAGTPDKLKAIKVKWQENPAELSENAQMFGCLSTETQKGNDYDDQAPLLTINRKSLKLHAWIKRLASKITLIFDGRGLHDGIFVYINKVTIHDIPQYCHFGSNNKPANDTALIKTGETLYYRANGTISAIPNEPATDVESASKYWLEIDKATVAGAVTITNGDTVKHPEKAQALYFYENCQGDFENDSHKNWYNKTQNPDSVGTNLTSADWDWKDHVPYGTYIEVEAYYSASYKGYLSNGPIKYRFMLGQNTTYNYDALRNRHYKLTLKFRGYANQPDWHIEYYDEDPGLYPPEQFYMSYLYNVRHEMPIRLTGKPKKVTMQIVENNWAPYDSAKSQAPYFVPPEELLNPNGLNFEWAREVYENKNATNNGIFTDGGYYYGLHPFTSQKSSPYSTNIIEDAPEWVRRDITPIWVGFLALQVPSGYEEYNTSLPTGIYNNPDNQDRYNDQTTIAAMKAYYYGKDDNGESNGREANTIPLYENVYNIPSVIVDGEALPSGESNNKNGRNSFTALKNADGSVTINVPMFTQPKDLIYISGFSGNNPYEAYYRKAVVKITAEYEDGSELKKYVPVYQMRRIINPKAIWRTARNTQDFTVKLMVLDEANDTTFTHLESRGEWEAWVAAKNDDSQVATEGPFHLSGVGQDGKVHGVTGSKIEFTIKFDGVDKDKTACGKIKVLYHGNTCEHSIYVRQGYNVPVRIGDNLNDKLWSSYAVFSFQNGLKPIYNGNKSWTLPGGENGDINNLKGTLTVNPLALGTLFKRGNYQEGIRIINNKTYGPLTAPGPLELTSGEKLAWSKIFGIPCLAGDRPFGEYWSETQVAQTRDWQWSSFISSVPDTTLNITYNYDFPTIDDYKVLMTQGFGIGVMYADGATTTAETTGNAFGFFNENNNVTSNTKGMRGFIVYNLNTYDQVFFPIGYSGVGRRTIQNAEGDMLGTLRYGAQPKVLSVTPSTDYNQYRPISYNNPNNPGAVYWAKGVESSKELRFAMDMNFFDLTFGPASHAMNFPDFGDALPIKPIVIGGGDNSETTRKPRKKKTH